MLHPLLYEINTRCWLRGLSDRAGSPVTLATVPEAELARWRRLGFTHIWLMGVWTGGSRARAQALADPRQRQNYAAALPDWTEADVLASPYAIADYIVPAQLGGDDGLAAFRKRLHAHGLKLVVDFVPNHLGLDHRWVRERPELFVQKAAPSKTQASGGSPASGLFLEETRDGPRWLAHGKDPFFPAWTDTVQLDYRQPATRNAMLGLLESIAGRCDGVRCDMAMLLLKDIFAKTWADFPPTPAAPSSGAPMRGGAVPADTGEFWAEATARIKAASPGFIFLAEAYWGTEVRLQELGFDYTYDKTLYDKLVNRDPVGVQSHVLSLEPRALAAGAHFLENHDEPRVAELLEPAEQRAAALVVLGLPGLRLLHEGQLEGARRRLPVQLARRLIEPGDAEIEGIYDQMLTALKQSAVGKDKFELLRPLPAWPGNPTAQDFVLVRWAGAAGEFDLVVVNLAPHRSQCRARLAGAAAQPNWSLQDRVGPEHYVRSGAEMEREGLYLDLPPHGAQIFRFTPVAP